MAICTKSFIASSILAGKNYCSKVFEQKEILHAKLLKIKNKWHLSIKSNCMVIHWTWWKGKAHEIKEIFF